MSRVLATRSFWGIIVALIVLAALAFAQEQPDELRLRNGTSLKGRVVWLDENAVTFRGNDGVKEYKRSDVSAIFFAAIDEGTGEFPPGFTAKAPHKLKRVITFHQITNNKPADQRRFEPEVAKISANGSKIAFWSRGSGLYTINSDGTNQRLVWENNNDHSSVEWTRFELSPDGNTVYWQVPPFGAIRRVNADGSNMKTLVNNGAEYEPLRLRQAGKRIFFGSRAGIFSIDTDGNGDYKTIIDPKRVAALVGLSPNDDSGRAFLGPFDVSEDGSRVVLNVFNTREQKRQLATMNADGTGFRFLTRTDFEPAMLSMTPDGSRVIFWNYAQKAIQINWDGTGLRELNIPVWDPNASGFQHMSRFTPDGKWFAYDGGEGGGGHKIVRLEDLDFFEPNNIGRLDYFGQALFWGMYTPSYTSDQRRYSTISQFWQSQGPKQIVVADINPRRADLIPTVSDIEFPTTLSINPQLPTHSGLIKVRARPATGDIQRVWFLLTPNAGKRQNNPQQWRADSGWWALEGNHIAHDDGANGDQTKGDGIFTGNLTAAASTDVAVPPGHYLLRIIAHDALNAAVVDVDGIDIK
jgi:hypothetical protein